jgi:hypothetical protein
LLLDSKERLINNPFNEKKMDFTTLLSEGRRVKTQELSKGRFIVNRSWYALPGEREIPIIEKSAARWSGHYSPEMDIARLEFWAEKGLRIPEIALSSRRVKSKLTKPTLLLSDLSNGGENEVIDFYGEHQDFPCMLMYCRDGSYLERLDNVKEVKNQLAYAMAQFFAHGHLPTVDHFMVQVTENRGQLYVVDVEYNQPLEEGDLEKVLKGDEDSHINHCLLYSGIDDTRKIGEKCHEVLRELL